MSVKLSTRLLHFTSQVCLRKLILQRVIYKRYRQSSEIGEPNDSTLNYTFYAKTDTRAAKERKQDSRLASKKAILAEESWNAGILAEVLMKDAYLLGRRGFRCFPYKLNHIAPSKAVK